MALTTSQAVALQDSILRVRRAEFALLGMATAPTPAVASALVSERLNAEAAYRNALSAVSVSLSISLPKL